MANHLPDEIIAEILSPALKVPDDVFSDNSRESPFAQYSESSSAFLLVSKAWLRVSTPLLYHVVVLRSTAQAAALERALKMNPELGHFIKKLRLEGGYGIPIHKIIKSAPNISDLFLTLGIWSSDSVGGLVRGLPLMNPTRLILGNNGTGGNKNCQLLMDALATSLKEWTNLAVLDLPWDGYFLPVAAVTIGAAIRDGAPNLKTVLIADSYLRDAQYLALIAKNKSVTSIQPKKPTARFYSSSKLSDPSLRGLIKIPELLPEDNSLFNPFVTSPDTSEEKQLQFSTGAVTEDIWKRIIHFSMVLEFNTEGWPKRRLGVLLVSKLFARLALPHYYEALSFHYPRKFKDFTVRLSSDESLRLQVRTLHLRIPALNANDFRSALPQLNQLMQLSGGVDAERIVMSYKMFKDLATFCGDTLEVLEGIEVSKGPTIQSPAVFAKFRRLKKLGIGFKAKLDVKASSIPATGGLPDLEELVVSHADETVVAVLAKMHLALLRAVSFSLRTPKVRQFFAKHGSKLGTVGIWVEDIKEANLFDQCPGVVEVTVHCAGYTPQPESFTSSVPHATLKTITFKPYGRIRAMEQNWKPFFRAFCVDTFPALEQVFFPHIKWPTTEHNIAKSAWVSAAERLLESEVALVNFEGVGWRKRLKK
ncbi:hypothetical protein FB45DRAFT_897617 [Roridomyces roridus]|uniref:Uncharacterized protein n=1 Tax=Roridomyces roridus TaxID=1738132 RepID=A0AAD7CBC2_9AGAR|nr:hypothetical protein FB45DRAFT_897617 [Roridomyces roridus]